MYAFRDVDQQAVLCKHGVEQRHAVVSSSKVAIGGGGAVVIFLENVGVVSSHTAETVDDDALGQEYAVRGIPCR